VTGFWRGKGFVDNLFGIVRVRKILFLCTGNYYRSRFAEGLFNHLAMQAGVPLRADSRGLALGRDDLVNVGPISEHTKRAFEDLGVALVEPVRYPLMASREDFESADEIIALKEAEHREMVRAHFPEWENKVTYWHVHDVDQMAPEIALAELETYISALVEKLSKEGQQEGAETGA
jgi:protein-tyrosine phosphatase